MPSKSTVEQFLARVESGATVEAIQKFYAPDASIQENLHAPRRGREALVQHERQALAGLRSLKAEAVRPYLMDGDVVVIRWVFVLESKDGSTTRLEELAYQRWQGEKIAQEQFFYDPGQCKTVERA